MRDLYPWKAIRRAAGGMVAIATVTMLASCGGSDDGQPVVVPPVASNTPPASASVDVNGFIAFMKALVATQQDTAQPLDVTAFVAPTTDTGLPDPSI